MICRLCRPILSCNSLSSSFLQMRRRHCLPPLWTTSGRRRDDRGCTPRPLPFSDYLSPEAQAWLSSVGRNAGSLRDTQSYLFPASQLRFGSFYVRGRDEEIPHGYHSKAIEEFHRRLGRQGCYVPFALGASCLGWIFFHYTDLFPKETSCLRPCYYSGALPCVLRHFRMLARIIHFKRLTGTTMGTVAGSRARRD